MDETEHLRHVRLLRPPRQTQRATERHGPDGADSQAADASPALPGSVPERCPLRCRLSARRRVASPPRQPRGGRCPNYRPGVDGISFTVHPVGRRGPLDPQPTARIHYWSQLNGCLPRVLLVEALPRRPDTGGQPPRARRLSPPLAFPSTAAPRPAWTQPHPRVQRPHWSTQTVPVATKPKCHGGQPPAGALLFGHDGDTACGEAAVARRCWWVS